MSPFVCLSTTEPELLSPAVLVDMGLESPQELHGNARHIAEAAAGVCHSRGGTLARLPFCNTLEAESLGASVRLSAQGAFVPQQPYASAQELPKSLPIASPRIDAMMQAVSILHGQGLCVAYGVTGIFTILSQLVPMGSLFKALRGEEGRALLERMESACLDYAEQVCRAGAQILSYADPVATVDIVGRRTFCTSVAPCLARYLSGVQRRCPDATIFLCGKMSQSLLDAGAARFDAVSVPPDLNLEQALLWHVRQPEGKGALGLGCLNRLDGKCSALSRLHFEGDEG